MAVRHLGWAVWLALGCGGAPVAVDGGVPPTDAGVLEDGGAGHLDAGAASPCTITPEEVRCPPRIDTVPVNGLTREVYWQRPSGAPPATGWPVVLVFQGSFFGPASTWGTASRDLPFGGYEQARLQALLLERGYLVLAPSAVAGLAWQTNTAVPWALSSDKVVIDALLADLSAGRFGPVDGARLFATGISSGGYMTSRMALSYAGRFRALAIQSASWATCAGPLCVLPASLPADHPPTLFLHGRQDATVPLSTAEPYVDALKAQGTTAALVVDDAVGHAWLPVAPERIVDWFQAQGGAP